MVKQIILPNDKIIIIFIDESSIVAQSATKTGRGFVGVTPTVTKGLSNDKLSLLTAVIPGYGEICRFYDGSVNSDAYFAFIRETSNIISTHIGNGSQTLLFIQDNAHIHCPKNAMGPEICLLNTVPYSPELNFVVENYFGSTKCSIGMFKIL